MVETVKLFWKWTEKCKRAATYEEINRWGSECASGDETIWGVCASALLLVRKSREKTPYLPFNYHLTTSLLPLNKTQKSANIQYSILTDVIQKHETSEKVTSVLKRQLPERVSSGFHMHQLWFSSWALHLYFQTHCLFTASQSIIKTGFPKKWEARRSPNKRRGRGRGRKQPLTVSGVNKAITALIIMGFSIFLISGYRNLFPARRVFVKRGAAERRRLQHREGWRDSFTPNWGVNVQESPLGTGQTRKRRNQKTAMKSIINWHLAET